MKTNTTKSYASAPHCISKAFDSIKAITPSYTLAGDYAPLHDKLLPFIDRTILDGKASIGDVDAINSFLKSKGFSISLSPISPTDIALASVLDISVTWTNSPSVRNIQFIQDKLTQTVPGITFKTFKEYSSKHNKEPIFELATDQNFSVFVTPYDRICSKSNFISLQQHCQNLSTSLTPSYTYNSISFPCINLTYKTDLNLSDVVLTTEDKQSYKVSEAKAEAILKVNEKGAVAKAAVAVTMYRACVQLKPDYTIDRPFLIWFQDLENKQVYFAAHIFIDSCSRPESL